MSNVLVGLDIGTSTIRVVIGEILDDGSIHVLGVGSNASVGLRKGVVVNPNAAYQSISPAIESAEMMSGREVISCVAGIGGAHIESINTKGLVAVSNKNQESSEISEIDVDRVIEAAQAIVVPMDRQILHVIPRSYIVDGLKGIKNPLNMIGVRLEAEVLIITSSVTAVKNYIPCIERAGYYVDLVTLKTLAAAKSVMTSEEQELGSVLIDIGGGTTDTLVFIEGSPICSCSIPLGGVSVTNDISIVKGISFDTADRIKLTAGCCWEGLLEKYEEVIIPGIGGRPPESTSRQEICQIIYPRVAEILMMVRQKILPFTKNFSGNYIITGASALLPGMLELASHVFETSAVRIGIPNRLGGLMEEYRRPEYATATGLLLMHAEKNKL
ncbi:MAG: cell division protein FtsA, partial [Treponemataceae bacterium]